MASAVFNSLKQIPAPLFGTAATALAFTKQKITSAPRYAPWALPASIGALWFVWPAVDEEWKQSIGFSRPPAAAAPAAVETSSPSPLKVELSPAALSKVESAYVVHEEELSDEEKSVLKAMAKGDYSALEQDWDKFQDKATIPGDGDDDDDDEEEEDEDEDEDDE